MALLDGNYNNICEEEEGENKANGVKAEICHLHAAAWE